MLNKYMKGEVFTTVIIIVAAVAIATTVGIMSKRWLGDDNVIEEAAEEIDEDAVEYMLKLPKDSVHIDLSKGSKEKK